MQGFIRQISRTLTAMIGIAICAAIASADVKIKAKSTQGGNVSEQTTYIKGQRQRMDMANGMMISVTQCDLQRSLQIFPQSKTYMITPFNQTANNDNQPTPNQPRARQTPTTKGGVVTTNMTTKDTGERKQMFGYTARHYITTIVTESSPDACTPVKNRMEIDAWYIDGAGGPECGMANAYQNPYAAHSGGCQDRSEVKQSGPAPKGVAVWTKTTMFDENGKATMSFQQETVEITRDPLDASLFEIPAGYREVKNYAEAMTGGAMSGMTRTTNNDDSGMNASVKNLANKTTEPQAVGAKKAGVIRLGLVAVKTTSVAEHINAAELAAAVRNTLTEDLRKPDVEVVAINAQSPAQVDAEAKQKECDFVIYTEVEHKKGGGKFGAFAPALSSIASAAGYSGGTAGAVAGETASAAITATAVATNVKAKDQLTLNVKMQAAGSATAIVTQQFKAKAQSNGEDIISPVSQEAAQAILVAAKK